MLALKMCTCTYRKNIFVANINFGRSFLDLLSTDQQTGNKLAVSFLITFKLIFSGWTRKTWTRNLRGIQVLIFDTTRLKGFLFNFPQSSQFWDYCMFSKRLTLASARELDDLKLEEWKQLLFIKDSYQLIHFDFYRMSESFRNKKGFENFLSHSAMILWYTLALVDKL